jgi:hypothetical protein
MPKTYKTEIIGYSFEELSEDVKQKIYENDDFFSELVDFSPIEDTFRADLMECFGADPDTLEVYYDVSYSQGSGACCVGTLDVKTVLEKRTGSYFAELLDMIESGKVEIDTINIVRCGPANFYNHENTCQVEMQYSHNPTEFADIISTTVELEQMLTNGIREELCDFHSKLQDHYEESTSFEAYCEYMCSSDVVFTEAGKIVDPVYIKHSFVIDGYQLSLDFDDENSNELYSRDMSKDRQTYI